MKENNIFSLKLLMEDTVIFQDHNGGTLEIGGKLNGVGGKNYIPPDPDRMGGTIESAYEKNTIVYTYYRGGSFFIDFGDISQYLFELNIEKIYTFLRRFCHITFSVPELSSNSLAWKRGISDLRNVVFDEIRIFFKDSIVVTTADYFGYEVKISRSSYSSLHLKINKHFLEATIISLMGMLDRRIVWYSKFLINKEQFLRDLNNLFSEKIIEDIEKHNQEYIMYTEKIINRELQIIDRCITIISPEKEEDEHLPLLMLRAVVLENTLKIKRWYDTNQIKKYY